MFNTAEFDAHARGTDLHAYRDPVGILNTVSLRKKFDLLTNPEFLDSVRKVTAATDGDPQAITRPVLDAILEFTPSEQIELLKASFDLCDILQTHHPISFQSMMNCFAESEEDLPDFLLAMIDESPSCPTYLPEIP